MAGRRQRGPAFAAALAFVLAAGAANACERPQGWTGGGKIVGKTWTVRWQSAPAAIPVGAHFSLRFRLCGPPVARVKVRGWMPDHRHGMNYRAAVTLAGPTGAVRGLLFHMPGRWQLVFDIAGAAGREKLVAETVLE